MQSIEVTLHNRIKRTYIEYDGMPQLTVKRNRFIKPIETENTTNILNLPGTEVNNISSLVNNNSLIEDNDVNNLVYSDSDEEEERYNEEDHYNEEEEYIEDSYNEDKYEGSYNEIYVDTEC